MNADKFNNYFGTVLRQVRNREGLSQNGLADSSGVQRGYISDLERGKKRISLFKFLQLCEGFSNTSPEDFIALLKERL